MQDALYFLEVTGFFGYLALGIGAVMFGVMVVFLFSSAPWSRWAGLVLAVLSLLVGTTGWIVYHGRVTQAVESITLETHEHAKKYAPHSTKTVDHMREEIAATGYAQARYPFYLGNGIFLLGMLMWSFGSIRFHLKKRKPGTTGSG